MKYYYTMKTTMTNRQGHDPVRDFCDKYKEKDKIKVHYGNGIAVVELDLDMPISIQVEDIAEKEIVAKSAEDLELITDKRLIDYRFNAIEFKKEGN